MLFSEEFIEKKKLYIILNDHFYGFISDLFTKMYDDFWTLTHGIFTIRHFDPW